MQHFKIFVKILHNAMTGKDLRSPCPRQRVRIFIYFNTKRDEIGYIVCMVSFHNCPFSD